MSSRYQFRGRNDKKEGEHDNNIPGFCTDKIGN